MLNYHPPKPTFKDLTICSTWHHTFSHSKHCSHHIRYLNLLCISSLESYLQVTFPYQISSSMPKSIKSCAIEPKRVSRKQKAQLDNKLSITQNIVSITYVIQIQLALVH